MKLGILLPVFLLLALPVEAQNAESKVIPDTIAVQAEGVYETDPDVATLEFGITNQEKTLRAAYEKTSASFRKIIELAEQNGLKREEITTGLFSVEPQYEKRKIKRYSVQAKITLQIRDFSKIGPLLDELVQAGVTEFRTLTFALLDEEAARQKAVAEAMKHAMGRAAAVLEQNHQKLGPVRYASLDIKQMTGITRWSALSTLGATEMALVADQGVSPGEAQAPPPPFPSVQPDKISVRATVQCIFQIQ